MRQDLIKPFIENDAPIQKQFEQVKSYLYQFREQVEMMLQNIDVDNMAPQLAEPLDLLRSGSKTLSVSGNGSRVDINILSDMIKTRVLESTEFGEIESSITQMSSEIALKVSSGDLTAQFLIGKLNSGSTYATIDADRIDIDGVFTANGSFTIDQNGNLIFTGAGINIQTSSSSRDIIKLEYGSKFSSMYPGGFQAGDGGVELSLRGNQVGTRFQTTIAVEGDYAASLISSSHTASSHNIDISAYGQSLYIHDGASRMQAQWRMLSDIQNYNYVLVGVAT